MAATTEQTNAIEFTLTPLLSVCVTQTENSSEVKQFDISTLSVETKIAPTRFVYLTQTEHCIPTNLRSPIVIGDSEACQCDVIILSYKNECKDKSLPHVQYIFNSSKSTTWTVGRNLLYEAAKKRKEKYIHYIFMDDDVKLTMKDKKSTQNPWRMNEESLKTFQPAVVNIRFTNDDWGSSTLKFPEQMNKNCTLTRFIQTHHMDAIFNCFHYQAIDYILPYTTTFDDISWWHSQLYTVVKCNILFNGEVVSDPHIRVENTQHRSYPRRYFNQKELKKVFHDIRSETPRKYRKSLEPIFYQWLQWITDPIPMELLGRQTCKRDIFAHPYRPYENLLCITNYMWTMYIDFQNQKRPVVYLLYRCCLWVIVL